MSWLWERWLMGGWYNFVVLLFAFPATICAIVALLKARARKGLGAAIAGALLATMAFGAGLYGEQRGLVVTEGALTAESVPDDAKAKIRAEGRREARQCAFFGALLGGPAAALSIAAMLMATRRREDGENHPRRSLAVGMSAVVGLATIGALGAYLRPLDTAAANAKLAETPRATQPT